MKKNGFIASALLYGMLALFIVMMLSTLAILANRKLSVDRLKENAITAAETGYSSPENIIILYDAIQKPAHGEWKDQSGHGKNANLSSNVTFNPGDKFLQFYNGGYINTNTSQQRIKSKINENGEDRNFTIVTTVAFAPGFPANQTLWGYNNDYVYQTGGTGTYAITTHDNLKICVFDDRCGITEWMNINGSGRYEHIFCQYNPGDTSETNTNRDNVSSSNETCVNIPKEQLNAGNPVQLVVTLGNSGIATFINGKPYEAGAIGIGTFPYSGGDRKAEFKPSNANIVIGAKNGYTANFTGKIYNFILYNGSLSYSEGTNKYSYDIPTNCQVDKEKYGIDTNNC